MTPFDSKELRRTLGAFTTGVTVVTTIDSAGKHHGVTANSFTSVSLDPPLILWSQALTSRSYSAFNEAERFVVNIMADDQVHVSNQSARSIDDKFAGIRCKEGLGGVLIIEGTAAHLECTKIATYPGGDHVVYIGRVDQIHRAPRKALAFGEGKYMVAFAHDLGGSVTTAGTAINLAGVEAVRLASASLPEICEQLGQRTVCLAVWGNRGPTIVRWEPSSNPVSEHLRTGVVVSITRSATGKAFAAFMPRDETQDFIDDELAVDSTIGVEPFELALAEVRSHKLARAMDGAGSSRHGARVNAFSAPVFDASGAMVLAISTTCRADSLAPDWDGPVPMALAQAAAKLTQHLGYVAV